MTLFCVREDRAAYDLSRLFSIMFGCLSAAVCFGLCDFFDAILSLCLYASKLNIGMSSCSNQAKAMSVEIAE